MKLHIPELSLVVLMGSTGAGKSTFAHKHFRATEVLSSDTFRGLVSDDESDQSATEDAFAALHFVAARRLARGRTVVIDATNVQAASRRSLIALAKEYHVLPVAIALDVSEQICVERNQTRPDRAFGPRVARSHVRALRSSLRGLEREGFRRVHVLHGPEEIDAAELVRERMWSDHRHLHGPFDIIGDIHGCATELESLLDRLGYDPLTRRHPEGRTVVYLGDLVDRGPNAPGVLRRTIGMVQDGSALCVPGNHDAKLLRQLRGKNVKLTHGLAETVEQLARETPEFRAEVATFIDGLVSHLVLDDGRLVVAHAGMKEAMQGRGSGRVREFALYGETTGEIDAFGLPVRYPWAEDYRGRAMVVYGHTPVPEPEWLNGTLDIDTGCVFGGSLTALRYPERELVSVPALQVYCEPVRPLASPAESLSAQQASDKMLDLDDVLGKRHVSTRLSGSVTVREENAAAALEVMSRFAADPRWLVYLPPTMSPCETAPDGEALERPAEAFTYFRNAGVTSVICEEKHMGSRAVIVVCRDAAAATRRFGVETGEVGVVCTRTGRRFFKDLAVETELIARVRNAADAAGLFAELETDWLLLDAELMPWSAKAQDLLRTQYAAVGAAAHTSLAASVETLSRAMERGLDVGDLLERTRVRAGLVGQYVDAYRRYCWEVSSVDDLRVAPFHLLASEGHVHVDRDHAWHMQTLARLVPAGAPLMVATEHRVADLDDPVAVAEATRWWEALTARGGEGMVVKPLSFIARGRRGLVQPALKVRGAEYLRIIYGPEYTRAENLERLRARSLKTKRSLALREFALGIEGLERFVRREPLRRVHACVFGVLAMESEPVDPRL